MKIYLALLALLIVGACIAFQDESTGDSTDDRPGSAAVYSRLESMSDCAQLQEEFDTAADNHDREIASNDGDMAEVATAYMEAADQRMREVGCYG